MNNKKALFSLFFVTIIITFMQVNLAAQIANTEEVQEENQKRTEEIFKRIDKEFNESFVKGNRFQFTLKEQNHIIKMTEMNMLQQNQKRLNQCSVLQKLQKYYKVLKKEVEEINTIDLNKFATLDIKIDKVLGPDNNALSFFYEKKQDLCNIYKQKIFLYIDLKQGYLKKINDLLEDLANAFGMLKFFGINEKKDEEANNNQLALSNKPEELLMGNFVEEIWKVKKIKTELGIAMFTYSEKFKDYVHLVMNVWYLHPKGHYSRQQVKDALRFYLEIENLQEKEQKKQEMSLIEKGMLNFLSTCTGSFWKKRLAEEDNSLAKLYEEVKKEYKNNNISEDEKDKHEDSEDSGDCTIQ